MKIAYFDCFAGISGDMCLGALIDAGADAGELSKRLGALNLPGWKIEIASTRKAGISATKASVSIEAKQEQRTLHDILSIIEHTSFPEAVVSSVRRAFTRLAEAEAKVHGVAIEEVHFHEVGAVDAIVDIVGSALALHMLGIDRVLSSPLPSFHGFAKSAHGVFPLPAPATLELIRDVPVRTRDVEGELVTPTGAAIITTLADYYGPIPSMRVSSIGYGAGTSDYDFPNVLRIVIGEEAQPGEVDEVRIIEANIDDLNPEFYEVAMERLFAEGALDVYLTPVQMKKSRPGTLVTVLCAPQAAERLAEVLFAETSTIGVRIAEARRLCLRRTVEAVETPYGRIRIKVSRRDNQVKNAAPEYEDCKAAATAHSVPVKMVYAAALARFHAAKGG